MVVRSAEGVDLLHNKAKVGQFVAILCVMLAYEVILSASADGTTRKPIRRPHNGK